MTKSRIAFLGLGIMGGGMARRLLANRFLLTVFNRNVEKSKIFAVDGAAVANSPREAAQSADVIISMIADDNASRSLWFGENGAFAGATAETVCIECSTVTVSMVRELAASAEQHKCRFLDAPVTGSKAQAAAGELKFLVGGSASTLELVRPVLAAMSQAIIHVGPTGSGALLKLVNNFICGVQVAALAEALAVIEHGGLDRTKAVEILADGAPGSPLVKAISTRMIASDFTPNFLLRLMTKDLGYAIQEGDKLSIELLTATAALNEFQRAIASGHGDEDIAAVVKPFRKN